MWAVRLIYRLQVRNGQNFSVLVSAITELHDANLHISSCGKHSFQSFLLGLAGLRFIPNEMEAWRREAFCRRERKNEKDSEEIIRDLR